ncbi:MAG: recombinase family protein [Oscillospiraceae bacterium]|nr:recombinase family protein [Oscillospiraceae bacterium]
MIEQPTTYGYARISTQEQNESRQLTLFVELGIAPENVFVDKLSGKNTDRPALRHMMSKLQRGDKVVVESYSRLARNLRDLFELTDIFKTAGVVFESRKENISTNTPQGRLMLALFGGLAEFERENLLQRQAEGIAIAKANAVYSGRKSKELKNFDRIAQRYRSGELKNDEAAKILGISRATFFRRLQQAA